MCTEKQTDSNRLLWTVELRPAALCDGRLKNSCTGKALTQSILLNSLGFYFVFSSCCVNVVPVGSSHTQSDVFMCPCNRGNSLKRHHNASKQSLPNRALKLTAHGPFCGLLLISQQSNIANRSLMEINKGRFLLLVYG